jgi:hypothetical protein
VASIHIIAPQVEGEYSMSYPIQGYVRFMGEKGRAYSPTAVITDVSGREKDRISLIGKWGSGTWDFSFGPLALGEYFFLFWLEEGLKKTPVHIVRFYVTTTETIETVGGGVCRVISDENAVMPDHYYRIRWHRWWSHSLALNRSTSTLDRSPLDGHGSSEEDR